MCALVSESRRFYRFSLVVSALAVAGSLPHLLAEEPPAAGQSTSGKQAAAGKHAGAKAADPDVSAVVRGWNAGGFSDPPRDFHAGTATPKPLDPAIVTKTKHGFRIKLPSGAPIPTLTVYDGKLYASGGFHSREFYCFDAESGKPIWAVDLDDDGPTSAAAEDGVIIFNTESCTTFALDAKTGTMLWSWFLGDPLATTPTISKGRVFTSYPAPGNFVKEHEANGNPPTHVLACFDLKTGKIIWQRWIDADAMTSPIAVDDDLYLSSLAGAVYRFKQADGSLVTARAVRATSAPVVTEDAVYFTRRADEAKAKRVEEALVRVDRQLDREQYVAVRKAAPQLDVAVQARSKFFNESTKQSAANGLGMGGGFGGGGAFQIADVPGKKESSGGAAADGGQKPDDAASPVAENIGFDNVCSLQGFQGSRVTQLGRLNVNCMGDQVCCTDVASGRVIWEQKLAGDLKAEGGYLAAPPAAAGGRILLSTLKGDVLELDPAKGSTLHRFAIGAQLRFQPTVVNGRIYVGTQDGQIVCVDTGDKTLTGWSTWGGNAAHTGIVR